MHISGKTLLACLLTLVLTSPVPAWAWGHTGHEAVAYVAWQSMTPATRTRVIELLKRVPTLHNPDGTKTIPGYSEWVSDLPPGLSQDETNLYLFMRAATWSDTIKHVGFTDSDIPPAGVTNDVNIGFTDTKSHGYWHFIDTGFASDHSHVPATPAPNVMTQIIAFRQAIASNENDDLKSYDLVWLEHIVGDVHQPLHGAVRYYAGKGDVGGNAVKVRLPSSMKKKFEGTLSKSAPQELHAFWDDLPGEGQPGPALPQAESFAKGLADAPADKVADTTPSDWATESFARAKKDVYRSPIGKGPKPAKSKSVSYLITTAYYDRAMQDADERIALAGSRLAKLLNENLK